MPTPVSKKQYRYVMALLHGKKHGHSARGDRMPENIARKYDHSPSKDAPESKNKEFEGGRWDKKKKKKDIKKSLHDYLTRDIDAAVGIICINETGEILIGQKSDGSWVTPGGHIRENESTRDAAVRELSEESGLVDPLSVQKRSILVPGHNVEIYEIKVSGLQHPHDTDELKNVKFVSPDQVPWNNLKDYCKIPLAQYMQESLAKSTKLCDMVALEKLEKNIIRQNGPSDVVYQLTHGDALRIIGKGTFKMLREAVDGMTDEDFRDFKVDNYTIHIRKHTNDIYSGRIIDGHKQIHQFTNKSLPAVAAELMSLFEWYLPEDEKELEAINDSDIDSDAIEGGLSSLMDEYKRHNIVNIYNEMENIRAEIRQGMAVDLQQVEQKIMKLFDKLENIVHTIVDKHNGLASQVGDPIDDIYNKLKLLQDKVDTLNKKPVTVDAVATTTVNENKVHDEYYPYLSKPSIVISPNGYIKITFGDDWTSIERSNFLNDMRAKVIKKK